MPLNPAPEALVATDTDDRVNILVVDDLDEKLLVFGTMLEELQQNVVFVRSGAEALREVLLREFAVILLDVNMPDIDGFETASLIRRYRRSAHTPIIFITAYADEPQTARGYSLGAVDYIQSPVVPDVLRSKVRVFVELHQLQRRMARQAEERIALAAAEEAQRRSDCLSGLSHALSGVLEPRLVVQTLRAQAVPLLARGVEVLPPGDTPGSGTEWPLRHAGRLLGRLVFTQPTGLGEALGPEVAERVAVALASAELHQSLQAEIAERRQAEGRLEEANRRKDEFLAMLSHELRNPLAPIRNAIEVIRRFGPQDAKLVWATDITDRQIRQLTRLVDELLDVARISQGKIVLRKSTLDLTALVLQCVEMQRSAIAARKQMLTQALPPTAIWVNADSDRLQQVVNNLLNNAIKYTPEGGRLHLGLNTEPGGQAVITLRDNGMGIEADLLPRIFDLFEQGQRTLDRTQGGLGVGLTLVQRLVRMHGGRIEASSAGPGQGAEFRVYLPCEQDMTKDIVAPGAPPAPVTEGRRIMLVEDNPDVAETTAAMLTLSGHTVGIARDGAEALEYAAKFSPEVVLLDIGLPMMDGYEVARRLRQMPQGRQARLIALTGYGQAADRQRGREAGFDDHLLKPVDPDRLAEVIALSPRLPEGAAKPGEGDASGGAVADAGPGEGEPPRASANLYTLRRR